MAFDVSQLENRTQARQRITANRDGLLPNRRLTDAPARQAASDMRSASRGSSAQALREVFGLLDDASRSFNDYANAKFRKDEEANAAKGAQDQIAGTIDPELQKKSRAYSEAVSLGESQKAWYEHKASVEEGINALLNDPEHPATDLEIADYITERNAGFGLTDGAPRDWGSARANLGIAQAMMESRTKWLSDASGVIKKQVEERAITTAGANYQNGLMAGDPHTTFEGALLQVAPDTDMKVAKAALITSAHTAAMALMDTEPERALGILDGLLASKREDGTPSLAPDEAESIRSERRRMGKEVEAAQEKKLRESQDKSFDTYLDRFNRVPGKGTYPTVAEVAAARSRGELDARDANSLISMIRSDKEQNGAGTVSSRRGGGGGGNALSQPGDELIDAVFAGQMTVGEASAVANKWAAEGRFGTGTGRYKRLAELRKNFGIANNLDKEERISGGSEVDAWGYTARQRLSGLPLGKRRQAENDIKQIETAARAEIVDRIGRQSGQTEPGSAHLQRRLEWGTRYLFNKYKSK